MLSGLLLHQVARCITHNCCCCESACSKSCSFLLCQPNIVAVHCLLLHKCLCAPLNIVNCIRMTTSFSSLPIVDLSALSLSNGDSLSASETEKLSNKLYDVFATTGFAYLTDLPLSFSHEDLFGLAKQFFSLPEEEKMRLAKKTFRPENKNTYRG